MRTQVVIPSSHGARRDVIMEMSTCVLKVFLFAQNIGNARLATLEKDLGMTGMDYSVSAHHRQTSGWNVLMPSKRLIDCCRSFLSLLCGGADPKVGVYLEMLPAA